MEENKRKGGFKPGQSGNPTGRKKGTPNHITKDLRDRVKLILDNQLENVIDSLDRLAAEDPARHAQLVSQLMSYYMPKLTEDLTKQSPPVFILPAGAQIAENNQEQIEEDDEE